MKKRSGEEMKKILITGAGSYIGTSFEKYIEDNYCDLYEVDTIDMIDGSWREKSFVGYDTVYHVAGIAWATVISQCFSAVCVIVILIRETDDFHLYGVVNTIKN